MILDNRRIWWWIMDVWLWHWIQSPTIPMEASRRVETVKSTSSSVKCVGFAYYFLRLKWRVASWIRWIRNTTLKLCAECEKQFVRNAQNCGQTNLHHYNTPAYTLMLKREFLAKKKTIIMPQPPYSMDLAPADFFLFSNLTTPMKGKRFAMIEEIKEKSIQELLALSKSAFQKWFENWKKTHKCIWGDYFEGDKIVDDK